MRRILSVLLAAVLVLVGVGAAPAAATGTGQGCAPAFWKVNTGAWQGYDSAQSIASVFGPTQNLGNASWQIRRYAQRTNLLQALRAPDGPGDLGAATAMYRAGAAALLNAAHDQVRYPMDGAAGTAAILAKMRAAVDGRAEMLELTARLTAKNSGACPLRATQTDPDAGYVTALYRDVLGRQAAAAEVQGWLDAIRGGRTRLEVARGFVNSRESLDRLVSAAYGQIVGRTPTAAEMAAEAAYVNDRDSTIELRIKLLGLSAVHGALSQDAWIDRAYLTLGGRAPTAQDRARAAGLLAAGQLHAQVARSIANEPASRLWQINTIFRALLQRDATAQERTWYAGQAVFTDLRYTRNVLVSDSYYRNAARASFEPFIRGLYRDVLGRTASAGEVASWVARMQAGSERAAIAEAFVRSDESLRRIVTQAYWQVLGRAPDTGGLQGFTAALRDPIGDQHWSRTELLVSLIVSAEFRAKHSGRDWVAHAYRIFLGRSAGQAEIDAWASRLPTMGYQAVARKIAFSNEAHARTVAVAYAELLGRAPGSGEAASWTARLANPPQNPADNPEYMARARQIGGDALVNILLKYALTVLGLGLISEAIEDALGVPDVDIAAEAEILNRLAHHPLHDLNLRTEFLSSQEYLDLI